MKKKIITLCLVVALAATAIIGGTLAYFTDTKSVENTFTAGGVKIQLIEQERDGNGGLKDFTQNKTLMPIVGSAQGTKDAQDMPVAKNYIDKIVTVKNTGTSAAYIRAYFAIPSALDDGKETYNAGLNILHFNFGRKEGRNTDGTEWLWKNADGSWKYFETTIDKVAYNVYYADYYKTVAANETTDQFVSGVYLDANVDMNDAGKYTITRKGVTTVIEGFDGSAKCPVFAVAAQAAGFETAEEAITAAFGANYNPWAAKAAN